MGLLQWEVVGHNVTSPISIIITENYPLKWKQTKTNFCSKGDCNLSEAFMAGAASHAGDADSSRAPGLTSALQGSVNVHRGVLLIVGATVTVHQFFCILHFFKNKCFEKDTISIFWPSSTCIGYSSGRFQWILPYQRLLLSVRKPVLLEQISSALMLYEWNV